MQKLSIGGSSRKYQPKRTGVPIGVSASISIRSASGNTQESSESAAATAAAAEEEEQNVFHIDKLHSKPACSRGKEVYILIGAICMSLIWLVVLTIYVAIHAPPPQAAAPTVEAKIQPILEQTKKHFKFPFTLQPDENTSGRIQTVQIVSSNFAMENVLMYDLCCTNASFLVCRTLTGIKNIGVDGYLNGPNSLIVSIIHPDMVGAKCNLFWINK